MVSQERCHLSWVLKSGYTFCQVGEGVKGTLGQRACLRNCECLGHIYVAGVGRVREQEPSWPDGSGQITSGVDCKASWELVL